MEPYRHVINDPHQCRLCLRVCDDTFLESIFSEKEYSFAHQIFECTSIRVTKQDNLTKICKNCAALLFITTEFRNACFKTNRLLMEDFVILEVGEWTESANQRTLQDCSELIVMHKQQVDYLYASIVPDSESYLAGSMEIERELFNSVSTDKEHRMTQKARDIDRGVDNFKDLEPEEPDPEIIKEITKFLEGQQTTECSEWCQICQLDITTVPEESLRGFKTYFKKIYNDNRRLYICEMCQLNLELLAVWQDLAQSNRNKSIMTKAAFKINGIKETQRHLLKQLQRLKTQLMRTNDRKPVPKETKTNKRRKQITCHLCGKQYDHWKLKAHLNEHEDKRPYVCDQSGCNSAFRGLDLLNRHKKLLHSDYFYKSCPVCDRKCKTQGVYKTHISYHEDPKLPCDVCGKLMRNKRSMWKHMKSHESMEERKHVCDICNKRFAVAYTLRVHRRIHTQEKPFACNICEKQFQYNCLLKNHINRYHNK
ncbi:PR domain zinc finger protein 5-like [Malaya genurostris]|uniref:PR domain zinc finger protein 5-like n=1 Tax=Malaya genurostris TaxID=325434 RepID=UPI0026F4020F|nr:PR domain zinc finger protein 5-like [Malaya genurostris]XP_058443529.1 PR domain zinc finger protein 5-like [Malaya genurostris]